MDTFEYHKVTSDEVQRLARVAILGYLRVSSISAERLARDIGIPPSTFKRWLIQQRPTRYGTISKILTWITQHKEQQGVQ